MATGLIRFRSTDSLNLVDVVFVDGFLGIGRRTGEDNSNSCIFVGPPESLARFYNNRDANPNEGQFTLQVPSMSVVIPDLAVLVKDFRTKTPASEPIGAINVLQPPGGYVAWPAHFINDFSFELSYVRFG